MKVNRLVRLSSVDKLPDDAMPILQAVYDAVLLKRDDQIVLLERLNQGLTSISCEKISASAFNRYVRNVRNGQRPRPQVADVGIEQVPNETLNTAFERLEVAIRDVRQALKPQP